jgi:hypothetical protein
VAAAVKGRSQRWDAQSRDYKKMFAGKFRGAPLRAVAVVVITAIAFLSTPARAEEPRDDAGAFFDGLQVDRQLAEQYAAPPARAPTVPALDDAALVQLEQEIDAAFTEARQGRPVLADERPGPLATVSLVLAGLLLLAFAGGVLTLAVRELRKDKQRRRTTYRRRVRRRAPTEATASCSTT